MCTLRQGELDGGEERRGSRKGGRRIPREVLTYTRGRVREAAVVRR